MIVMRVAQEWRGRERRTPAKIDAEALEHLVDNLAGLETPDTERLARQAIFNDGALTDGGHALVLAAKYQLLNRGGTLTYEPDTAKFADIGGLARLRPVAAQPQARLRRQRAGARSAQGRDAARRAGLRQEPRGARGRGHPRRAAAAPRFRQPLQQVARRIGEEPARIAARRRRARACVLWMDEMEKALARRGDGDGGVSRRVLGTFLTWLAEQRARIFVVATANDITALPPELVRKGRFDEIFFVDLPEPRGARGHPRDSRAQARNVS